MIANEWSRSINIGPTQNRYYDIHYFFNTLIKRGFFPELLTDPVIPKEVKDFVLTIVPLEYQSGEYVAKGGRILHNIEYITPEEILKTSHFFNEFKDNKHKVLQRTKNNKIEPKINNFLKTIDKNTQNKSKYSKKSKSKAGSKSRSKSGSKTKTKIRTKSKSKPRSKSKSKSKSKSRTKSKKIKPINDLDIEKILLGNN
jgi:hypothetical protein